MENGTVLFSKKNGKNLKLNKSYKSREKEVKLSAFVYISVLTMKRHNNRND